MYTLLKPANARFIDVYAVVLNVHLPVPGSGGQFHLEVLWYSLVLKFSYSQMFLPFQVSCV